MRNSLGLGRLTAAQPKQPAASRRGGCLVSQPVNISTSGRRKQSRRAVTFAAQEPRSGAAPSDPSQSSSPQPHRQHPIHQEPAPPTAPHLPGRHQYERAADAAAEATLKDARQQQQLRNPAAAGASSSSLRIEALRTHPHEFNCTEPSTCGGTIVVAMDDTDNSAAAAEWVVENLYNPDVDELRVVHVVCDPRGLHIQTSLGAYPSGRCISMDSLDLGLGPPAPGGMYGDVEVTLKDYLSRLHKAAEGVVARRCEQLRRLGVKYQTELPSLPAARSAAGIAEVLLDAVARADAKLLVVASHGPGALAEFGSVSRFCHQHSKVPLLLVPSPESQAAAHAAAARRFAPAPPPAAPPAPAPPPAAAAAAADVRRYTEGAAAPSAAATAPAGAGSEILLVVNHLEELANVWQWVADNCARKGDSVSIWHVAGPSLSGMPSLPTALTNQLRRRGLANVSYKQLYSSTGDPQDLGDQVCDMAASNPAIKLVVLLNYSRRGLVQEALHGSVASHLSRHCPKPLLLLQLPE